jgi:hypothetical protein
MLKAAAGESKSSEPERKRRKHHHRSHRDSEDRDSRQHSRRHEEERDRHRSSRHHRRRSDSPSISRPPPPPRRPRRSPSPYRRRRSYSPDQRERSRSPYRGHERGKEVRKMQSWHSSARPSRPRSRSPRPCRRGSPPAEEDRATKLAAMQQAASELDQDRERRLATIAAKDRAEAEKDDASRARNAKYGGRADFVNGLNRKVIGELDLGDRVGRGKAGMEREQEAY